MQGQVEGVYMVDTALPVLALSALQQQQHWLCVYALRPNIRQEQFVYQQKDGPMVSEALKEKVKTYSDFLLIFHSIIAIFMI